MVKFTKSILFFLKRQFFWFKDYTREQYIKFFGKSELENTQHEIKILETNLSYARQKERRWLEILEEKERAEFKEALA